MMIKKHKVLNPIYSKIRDLTALRKSCVEWRQIEIDKEINELQKLKEDVKRTR